MVLLGVTFVSVGHMQPRAYNFSRPIRSLVRWSVEESMEDPVIISLHGEYDVERLADLRAELEPHYRAPYLVLDLTEVAYCDSACLCEFIRMRKARSAAGMRPACFVIRNDRLGRLFHFLGLDEIFTVVESLDDAMGRRPGRPAPLTKAS
ncbi:MAG TPA: STAS domain-containing protein [Candidatus Acidoferrales bacterium]|nr:STAS domain-containing protein [Candidatus Acidoferrales bacterium]